MHPLTFPCPACGKRMGVGLELAGKSVRCPHCQQVVTAPSAAKAPPARPAAPGRESHESIFSDPEESEDAVIGGGPVRKLQVPRIEARTPPTPRPAGPAPAAGPDQWLTADEAPSSLILPRTESVNLQPHDLITPDSSAFYRRPPAPSAPGRTTAVIALAVYAAVMTVLAVWGWMR